MFYLNTNKMFGFQVVPTGGVVYEWQSPAERKERIEQLEDWIHRPKEELELPAQEFDAPNFTQQLIDLGTVCSFRL